MITEVSALLKRSIEYSLANREKALDYALEYGEASLEMHRDALVKGERVVVEGVVVGDYETFDRLAGFFVQEEDADADGLGDGQLDVVHVLLVPQRLEDGVPRESLANLYKNLWLTGRFLLNITDPDDRQEVIDAVAYMVSESQ